ncbi:hypothetical protein [Aquimarina macrocephali]|uniref:hypothetical protein n=1 Tax=Aquimarina macrocephali TaxID=666563 RepID=UPI003F679B99
MDITTELNGEKYLIVEILATRKTSEKDLLAKLKRHNAIYQGIKEINTGGFWGNAYGVFRVLVPEQNVVAFNNDNE